MILVHSDLRGLLYLSVVLHMALFVRPRPNDVPVDLSHALITTSPLKHGSNSSELLVPDFSRQPTCVLSLPLVPSWILIDLGYVVSGVSQVRLFSDYYLENAHEMLTDIDVETAEYLPPSAIQRSNFFEGIFFTRCGGTGTVSKETSNAVVDCASSASVRWILLKKQGQLHLCYVQILQNSVKPECFQTLSPNNTLYDQAKKSLSVFKSKRYVTFLECLQNCDSDPQCGAVAYMPLVQGTGICQLLRTRPSSGDFLCDESCLLRINRCHLGRKAKVKRTDRQENMRLAATSNSSYAVSIEITGVVSCDHDLCGRQALFLRDSRDDIHQCGSIDSAIFRVLFNSVFICERPVRSPTELIIKSSSQYAKNTFDFSAIFIRYVKKGSFSLKVLFGDSFSSSTTSTTSVVSTTWTASTTLKASTTLFTSSTSTVSTAPIASSTSSTSTVSTTSLTFSTTTPSTTSITSSTTTISTTSTTFKKFTIPSTTSTNTSSKPRTPRSYASISQGIIKESDKVSTRSMDQVRRLIQGRERIGPAQGLKVETGLKTATTHRGNIQVPKNTTDNTQRNSSTNDPSTIKTMTLGRRAFPFLWVIFLVFGTVLILVTAIVVVVTFLDRRRKMKQWEIPPNGLCPPDNGSESITMQTSMQVSTIRRLT